MIKLINILTEALTGNGDCYQAAGRLVTSNKMPAAFRGNDPKIPKDAKLVHGMVNGQGHLEGYRYGHAWVEAGNTVMDYANGRKLEIPKDLYYRIGGIDPKDNHYYDMMQAIKWMMKTKHWGPWEMSGDTVKVYQEDFPEKESEIGQEKEKIRFKKR